MSRNRKKIYHRRSPAKVILAVLGVALLAVILLSALIFFGFQKYAVYTDDGVTLEVPWLEEYRG